LVSGGLTLTNEGIKAPAMADQAPQDVAALSFEDALKRLEEIVRKLESGEASLDEAIQLYSEGDRLKQQCEARLKAAQARIEQIQLGPSGAPSGTIPFGAD
jgi:exodeoxyribonuclease VII small subunit